MLSGGLSVDTNVVLIGEHCTVVPYKSEHMDTLFELTKDYPDLFAYLHKGPFKEA